MTLRSTPTGWGPARLALRFMLSLGALRRAVAFQSSKLRATLPIKSGDRHRWKRSVDVTFISQAQEDQQLAAIERLARETLGERSERRCLSGAVSSGSPELSAVCARRELQASDLVPDDRLATPEILELARPQAQRIYVGREGPGAA